MSTATRDAFGQTLVRLAGEGLDFVVVDGGVSAATRTKLFAKAYPDRFFNCGISEQNMVSVAAGLAASGLRVVAASFAAFMMNRAYDQMRLQVAQPHLNVKLVGSHGGITVGEDGISAQAIEDLALACALPGVSVVVPADGAETESATRTAIVTDGPFYMRCSRHKTPDNLTGDGPHPMGKMGELRSGSHVTIVSNGIMVSLALQAATQLATRGIEATVLNASWLRPFDEETLVASARHTGCVVVATEHLHTGGLVGLVTSTLARTYPVPVDILALDDYSYSAPAEALLAQAGFTVEKIQQSALHLTGAVQQTLSGTSARDSGGQVRQIQGANGG